MRELLLESPADCGYRYAIWGQSGGAQYHGERRAY